MTTAFTQSLSVFIGNPFSQEARRFADIHPDHPDADDARRAFEAVTRALPSVEALRLIRVEGAA